MNHLLELEGILDKLEHGKRHFTYRRWNSDSQEQAPKTEERSSWSKEVEKPTLQI